MFLKDPDAVLDYRVDWTAAAGPAGTIAASVWAATPDEPGGLVLAGSLVSERVTAVRISGGIAGHVYVVGNRVTLGDGQVDERSLTLRVEHR